MVQNITPKQLISAYSRLLDYSATKRYGIKADFVEKDDIGQIALNINKDILRLFNLDIFKLNKKEALERYELILEKFLDDYTESEIISQETIDEHNVIKDSFRLDIDYFKSCRINLWNESYLIPHFNLNFNTIKKLFFEAENIVGLPEYSFNKGKIEDSLKFILSTIKFKYQGEEKIVLMIGNLNKERNSITIINIVMFHEDYFGDLFDPPLRLFFKFKDNFSFKCKIGDSIKNFFYHESFPWTELKANEPYFNVVEGNKQNSGEVISSYFRTDLGLHINFFYVIDIHKYQNYFNFNR